MNTRILEIMARTAGTDTSGKWMGVEHAEKLIQLVIQECCEVAHCNSHVSGLALGRMFKEHFGIEP